MRGALVVFAQVIPVFGRLLFFPRKGLGCIDRSVGDLGRRV
jgi:hypothetical protein